MISVINSYARVFIKPFKLNDNIIYINVNYYLILIRKILEKMRDKLNGLTIK